MGAWVFVCYTAAMQYGPLLIFIAAVLWGLDGILRRSLYGLPPATIVFYEHLIGAILIAPFLWKAWKEEVLSKNELTALGLVSLLSGVLGTLFFTTALLKINFIPFSVVFLLQKLQPIFTIITAWIVLGEKASSRYLPWAALALVAGYFMTFPNGVVNMSGEGAHVSAALLALAAAIAWGSSTAFSRYVLIGHSNTLVTGMRFLLTVPLAFGFVLGFGQLDSVTAITGIQILTLFAIALSTGMLALWIYYRGLKTTPARISAIVELAFPMTAILIDYFLYGTTLIWTQYLAAAILLFAMYKVAQLNSPKLPEAVAQAV